MHHIAMKESMTTTSKPDNKTPDTWNRYLESIKRHDESRRDGVSRYLGLGSFRKLGGVRADGHTPVKEW